MLPRPNKRWVIRKKIEADIDSALADYPSYFRQILYGRGVTDPLGARAFLDGVLDGDSPSHLLGMNDAITRIIWAIDHHEPVAVYGDYDVDGVTATALLVQVLRCYGAEARPYIPDRVEEGYGLNIEAVEKLAHEGIRLLVTVDCGIRSPREAERANELELDLIIIDHHIPGDEIPKACAVICQKQADDHYPYKDLSGVGLAYKVAQALASARPEAGVDPDDWLDLVALGTVADVVPLIEENRLLVRRGLERMRLGMRPGLQSLANVARLNTSRLSAGDIGFMLGPRLNAAGRMETATDALNLLMAEDMMAAGPLSQKLDNQNHERQSQTRLMQDLAIQRAREVGAAEILFAFDTTFNPGIVGLAASRLVDIFYRPAIVGQQGPEFTRASCRSIREFHITQALDQCRDLLERHGGHALAAGFTIRNENVPILIERLREIAARQLGGRDLCPELHADVDLPLSELHPSFLKVLEKLQPTGQENPEAVFVSRNLRVVRSRTVGAESQHLKLTVSDGRVTYDAIAFRQGHHAAAMPERIDVMYVFELNEFNGRTSLQLNIRDLRPAGYTD